MRTILQGTLATVMLLIFINSAQAKGIPSLVVIKSARLQHPIELTDREILKDFSPWVGQFIDWKKGVVDAPSDKDQPFEILFYMKSRSGDLRLIYSVTYLPREDNEAGYIYLPGKDDSRYRTNAGTIMRENDDGKWHLTNPAWETSLKRLLASDKPPHEQ